MYRIKVFLEGSSPDDTLFFAMVDDWDAVRDFALVMHAAEEGRRSLGMTRMGLWVWHSEQDYKKEDPLIIIGPREGFEVPKTAPESKDGKTKSK